ncbi:MAG: glycoside hydrolase family 88 protein, partial [Candidatus Izemoplasmatales bacterium]
MSTKFIRQMMADFAPYHESKRMTYEDGIYLLALEKYYQVTKDEDFLTNIDAYLKRHIDEAGMIENYHLEEYNIDNILAGNALFFAYEKTHEKRYLKAIELLRAQLKTHPRTKSGSFWHKLRYPYQIWLDGLYMGQVFYLHYGLNQEDEAIIADCMKQIENVRDLLWDEDKKLYLHAYDERKVMQWADKTTGRSPNVWSRSVGWLAMAFVELYDLLEGKGVFAKKLAQLLLELLEGMLVQLDPTSKMWHQLVDKPSVEGNYLETSGSAMLAYAMLKGSR